MEIIATKSLFAAIKNGKTFLTLFERTYQYKDKIAKYFMVARGADDPPPSTEKLPDAVVIVSVLTNPKLKYPQLIMTSEYRIPLGCRELGFPAGLIDDEDYRGNKTLANYKNAAMNAAVREMREETGLEFTPIAVSPPNLYSSAGLTNESIVYVFGTSQIVQVDWVHSKHGLEDEDIRTECMSQERLQEILWFDNNYLGAYSKTAWPFMWAFANYGLDMKLHGVELKFT